MQEIHITFWIHEQDESWSVEINGKFYSHISSTIVDELVEYAVVVAEEALMNPEVPLASLASDDTEYIFDPAQSAPK
jgi:3-dehydroquinate dehydratase